MSLAPNLLQILSIPLLLPPNSLLLVWGWQNSRARQGWGRQLQTVKNKDTRPEIIWLPWHCPLCQALCSPSGDLLNWGYREAACSQEPAGRVLLAPTVTEPNPPLPAAKCSLCTDTGHDERKVSIYCRHQGRRMGGSGTEDLVWWPSEKVLQRPCLGWSLQGAWLSSDSLVVVR